MTLQDYLVQSVWAMERRVFDRMLEVLDRHFAGESIDEATVQAIVEKRDRDGAKIEDARKDGGVAIIPIAGVIAPHSRMVNGASQPRGTSVAAIRQHLRIAMADPGVHTILFDVESPGGSVQGIDELADEIRAARESKRIVSHTDSLMASAAYWLAASGNEIYASRTADVGSIGVYAVIDDYSAHYEARGIKTHVVSSGGVKGAGVQGSAVTDEQLDEVRASVNATNDVFVEAVSYGRGRDAKHVRKEWNSGRTWMGSSAAQMGLVDGVASFEALLARLQSEGGTAPGVQALEDDEHAARAADNSEGGDMTNQSENRVALQSSADLEKARAEGVEAERARVKAIQGAAHEDQRELADQLIEDGLSAEEAQEWLHADLRERYDALRAASAEVLTSAEQAGLLPAAPLYGSANAPVYGGTEEVSANVAGRKKDLGAMTREELHAFAAADWAARTEELRHEYMSLEGYEGNLIVLWKQAREGVI